MARISTHLLFIAALLHVAGASAGGSFEPVIVKSLALKNATDYELVVQPISSNTGGYKDPFFGNCSLFTVRGTYSRVHSAFLFPDFVTRKSHAAALTKLSETLKANSPVNLGWVGIGFVPVDPKNPCLVESRALHLRVEPEGAAVLSLHNAV
ncbi:MAG: hypothetical protein ACAH06_02235 [Methylophilaceae bacterium]